jgi:hypothetical protein
MKFCNKQGKIDALSGQIKDPKGGRRGAFPPGGLREKAGMAFCWKAAIELG